MDKQHTVVAILEAKPGKEDLLKRALMDVVKPSRAENSCIEFRLHQDQNNLAHFILYENWVSKEAHHEQYSKPYIVKFMQQVQELDLLAQPYQGFFLSEIEV